MISVPEDIQWRFIASMAFDTHHHAKYRCDEYGIQKESISRKSKYGYGFTSTKSYFFIDGIDKEFFSLDEMVSFYNEKFPYEEDNPEQEVVFVKVIRDRRK